MHKTWQQMGRLLTVLVLGGASFGLLASSLGCDYATYNNIEAMFAASGEAAIQTVSNGVFGNVGKDFDAIIRTPVTKLAQAAWDNWINVRIPQEVPPPYGANLVRP